MANILYVEDDLNLGSNLKLNLDLEGHTVFWGKSLQEANLLFTDNNVDIIILDLGLPDGSGLDLCKEIRSKKTKIPILVLSAELNEDVVVEALDSGANDYVKKPFSTKELFARINVMLRTPGDEASFIEYKGLVLNIEKRTLEFKNEEINLNRREFDLLKLFLNKAEHVVTREVVIQNLNLSEDIMDRTVDSHVSHLRKKLRDNSITDIRIKSEYGVGYRLL